MSTQHSRKTFFAQMLGLFAGLGVLPKLLAKPAPGASASSAAARSPSAPLQLKSEPRAVARDGDSV